MKRKGNVSHEMVDWQTFKLFESYLKYLYRTYCGRCVHPAGRALGRAHEPCGHNRDQSLVLASATQYRIVCRIVSNRMILTRLTNRIMHKPN